MINPFIVACLVISGVSIPIHGFQDTLEEDLELERQLKLIINKPPIKTIHTKNGDMIDCIDIYKQLAFDNPLLKDHKLQTKPSFQKSSTKNLANKSRFNLEKVQCPKGSIPIRRTTKEDLIREKQLLNKSILVQGITGIHHAELALSSKFSPYYSISGRNNAYNPPVSKGQMSLSHVWVQKGPISTNNKISLGWQVSPDLYGDNKTHLYALWTVLFKLIPKFILVQLLEIYLLMVDLFLIQSVMEPSTKDWWIHISGEDIGYFPAKLFSNLASADKVGWGGRTLTRHGSPSPQMGSGHFPDKNLYHACYFRTIYFENASRIKSGPEKYQTEKYVDKPNCFGLRYYGNVHGIGGYMLQFGGPGGKCDG
ncbi:uncharacterized protein LOC106753176 [Vigna radiata var. radiata]|uniref:Uncharacterized protein LOC106753176 n=1 Tax=Vigna radiata var. radiata TaxID=3916 RepID=A0A1S3T9M6_VIGRR|nr:uncharacterized protein LOC106753176 [Vigna radiata var. radiata]